MALLAVALLATGAVTGAPARAQAPDPEGGFLERIDQERRSRGLAPLTGAADLTDVARRHAQRMADRGEPYHNPDLGSEVQGWDLLAENVGAGQDVDTLHRAFMDSATHRANILHTEVTQVGVGTVTSADGRIWVVQVMRRPTATAAGDDTPQAAPGPEAEPAPAAQPAPAPPPPPPPPDAPVDEPAVDVEVASGLDQEVTTVLASAPVSAELRDVAAPGATGAADAAAVSAVDLQLVAGEADVPAAAWVAAFALVAAVGAQGAALCRLRLVALGGGPLRSG